MDPHSLFYQRWATLSVLMALFSIITLNPLSLGQKPFQDYLFPVHVVVDMFFFLHAILVYRKSWYTKSFSLVVILGGIPIDLLFCMVSLASIGVHYIVEVISSCARVISTEHCVERHEILVETFELVSCQCSRQLDSSVRVCVYKLAGMC